MLKSAHAYQPVVRSGHPGETMERSLQVLLKVLLLVLPVPLWAQEGLLRDRWVQLETENFVIFSQVSASRTERFGSELEIWRQVVSQIINNGNPLPRAAVQNHVYIFADQEGLAQFAPSNDAGFFLATPRRNFMALSFGESLSLTQARHHYVHFLMRNFADLRIPRWYEEGLAGYLDNLEVDRDRVQLPRYEKREFETSIPLSREVSLQELLYDEEALASPRLIQVANLKSETFLYFLLHAWEEGFTDRRTQLQEYLRVSLTGRTQRYAFDQAFDISTNNLDREYVKYLEESSRPRGTLSLAALQPVPESSATELSTAQLSSALAELALNAGNFTVAETLFRSAVDSGVASARSYSGVADALRMQERDDAVYEMREFYDAAEARGADDVEILLDLGEYWETVVRDCDSNLTAGDRHAIKADILDYFSRALAMAPDNPEANLAMAQYYLLDDEDFTRGISSQRKAVATLPADGFIMEQAVVYAIQEQNYDEALRLINELSQPLHLYGEPEWVSALRTRMAQHQQGQSYDACAE